MARNALTQARNVASARTTPTYPRTPVGGVYIPGAKSIEGATGDIARTTAGWIEDEKYKWRLYIVATAVSAEFDTAVTRTGAKTLKVSTTDITGKAYGLMWDNGAMTQDKLQKYFIRLKPSTEYTWTYWMKLTNSANARGSLYQYDVAGIGGTGINNPTSAIQGTTDWIAYTKTFTSDADAFWAEIQFYFPTAGNIADMWVDVNSMTLVETGVVRNPVV